MCMQYLGLLFQAIKAYIYLCINITDLSQNHIYLQTLKSLGVIVTF